MVRTVRFWGPVVTGCAEEDNRFRQLAEGRPERALDVVSALLTPPYAATRRVEETTTTTSTSRTCGAAASVRTYCGYMKKQRRRPPKLWRRRWVEVTLQGFNEGSRVAIRHDADAMVATTMLALWRDEEGAVSGFGSAQLTAEAAEFELRPPHRRRESRRFGTPSVKLRSIPGKTPDALVAALAALGWPRGGDTPYHEEDDSVSSPQSPGRALESRIATQALLLALGDASKARALRRSEAALRRMQAEAEAIAAYGVRAVRVPADAEPGRAVDENDPDTVVPVGVGRGGPCWYAPGRAARPGVSQSPRPSSTATDGSDAVDRLIDRAVASRVIDDFSARRIRNAAGRPEDERSERLQALLRRRLLQVRSAGGVDDDLAAEGDGEGEGSGSFEDLEDPPASEAVDDRPVDDPAFLFDGDIRNVPGERPPGLRRSRTEPRPFDVGETNVRVTHRGRWVEASVVDRVETEGRIWLTVRFDDASGDVVERRVRRAEVRPSLGGAPLNSRDRLPVGDGVPDRAWLPYSPRFSASISFDEGDDGASLPLPPPARPNLLRAISESYIPGREDNSPVNDEEHALGLDLEEAPASAPPAEAGDDAAKTSSRTRSERDKDSPPETDSTPQTGADATTASAADGALASAASTVQRRFRREITSRGTLTWAVEAYDPDRPAQSRNPTATCTARVPAGARPGARLMVRVPGFDEPFPVVVPSGAQAGARLLFTFFRVENADGSRSRVRWAGFPHSDLTKAPAWRRDQLERRLAELRLPAEPHNARDGSGGPVRIEVQRGPRFLETALAALPPRGPNWRRPWRVQFVGEPGIDASGVSREFWTNVSGTLFSPDLGLFKFAATDNLTHEISTLAASLYGAPAAAKLYRAAGRLLAKALLDRHIVSAPLSRPLLKHLLGLPIAFDDLQFVDASLHANLAWLLACDDPDDVELLCLNYTVAEEAFGLVRELELVPGGRDVTVTLDNRVDYVERRFRYAMMDRIEPALSPLLRGFYDVVPLATLAGQRQSPEQLDAQELELVMFGTTRVDVDDWRRYTSYRNLAMNDPRCLHFWGVVQHDFDDHQRVRLLQFVTGTARLPAGGFQNLQGSEGMVCHFELSGISGGDAALPHAHTCFNRLDLPHYSSYERMRDVLTNMLAVDVQGFTEQ